MALSTDQFRDQLIVSGLMSAEDISLILSSLPTEKQPQDGEQLARELVRQKRLTKFQAEQIYLGRGKSLVLGNYTILDKLGQGGMGMVLKAEHKRLKRLVALKVLSPAALKTPDALKRFHREVEAAAKLRHTNVVATDDADEAKGTHFLVMEYVEGSDLSALVKKKGPLSVGQALQCILQAARGLEYAHKQGVVHRDIKPANLLLDTSRTVKILDMGLARIEGDSGGQAELTSTGAVMGTVDYMAPEQALSTKTADARSDIYSLGISLWYLLTGKCAYDGDTLMAKLLAHRDAPIPSLTAVRSEVSASIDAVFQKMVAKQSKDRYQSMTDVIRDLEACQSGASSTSSLSVPTIDDDANPLSFLNNLGNSATSVTNARQSQPTTTRQVQPTATYVVADPAAEATMLSGDMAQITDPQTLTSVRAGQKRKQRSASRSAASPPWWQDRRVQIGGGTAAVLLLLAVVFLFQTPNGTLRVEILDPEVEMKVKGTELTFHGSDLEPVSLKAGEKKLLVTRGDLSFETEAFTLKKGTETRVKVELQGDKLVVNGGGKVIAEQPIQRKGLTTSTTGSDSVAATSPSQAIAPFDAKQAKKHQEAWAAYLKVPVEYTNSIGMKFRLIPPGEFLMGSTPDEIATALKEIEPNDKHWQECVKSEAPQHKVILTQPIYLGVKEVTQAEYENVMGVNPSHFAPMGMSKEAIAGLETAEHSVEMVSWNDAADFCAKLSKQEKLEPFYFRAGETITPLDGTGYRLPSEAEWEFACRAGTATKYWFGDQQEDLVRAGWFSGNSGGRTHAAGELKANPFGLYDIHGNVWEWVQDGWDATWYSQFKENSEINPSSPFSTDFRRMVRGGGWRYSAARCRSSARYASVPTDRFSIIGFRVALPVDAVKLAETKEEPPKTGVGKLFMHDPSFPQWVKDVQAMPAQKQLEAVSKKLVELNPGFDGQLMGDGLKGSPKIDNGIVYRLSFCSDHVVDISPVRALTKLLYFGCYGSAAGKGNVADLSPLEGMHIGQVEFQSTKVADLSPLRGMRVVSLNCANTPITSLAPLEGAKLTRLVCSVTQISDLSPLKGMPLSQLDCSYTQVSDLSALVGMSLRSLTVGVTKITDLSPLNGLPLEYFDCHETQVSDLLPLRGAKLTKVHIHGTLVTDLSPLDGMSLVELSLTPAKITQGIELIRKMVSLQSISANHSRGGLPNKYPPAEFWKKYDAGEFGKPAAPAPAPSSKLFMYAPAFPQWLNDVQAMPAEQQIEAVSKKLVELNPGFDGLVTKDIEGGTISSFGFLAVHVTDISPVRALVGLKTLSCCGGKDGVSKLSDLSPLEGMKLTTLYCHTTQISDLSPINKTAITYLHCGGNPISDLSPLRKMRITTLICSGTQVSDLSPLSDTPLTRLSCINTPVSDFSPLESCKSLTSLEIGRTKATPAQVAALQNALPNCKIHWDDPAKAKTR